MDLIDRLRQISARIPKQIDHLQTEEATKNALVMPFIVSLGYDVFDPTVVVPEFTADVGTKKGEKVDYVILDENGKPIILIECKSAGTNLQSVHASQLYRYFSVTEARFGVLTNGSDYMFFSDLKDKNKMDSRPFLEFNLLDVSAALAAELKKFTKDSFDLEDILSTASDLKYTKGMVKALNEEWANPTDELVRLLTSRVYSGRLTQGVRDQFAQITRKALAEFLNNRVNERLQSAIEGTANPEPQVEEAEEDAASDGIVTTDEEWEGFYAVKAILHGVVDSERVTMRDRKSYCGILLDDNNRKPICRLYFNATQKYISTFDENKEQSKHAINGVGGIFEHSAVLRETVGRYVGSKSGDA